MTAVDTRDVRRSFGDVVAVRGVSLTVEPGEVVGLVGANGAGKSTLIRLVLGLLAPDSGTVTVLGGSSPREVRHLVGYVPQGLGLWVDLTVGAHAEMIAAVYGTAPLRPPDAEIDAVWDMPAGALSLGLRRRVAFWLALAHDPRLLVLDEPTSGVDPLARARLWDAIRDAADSGVAVIVSTHYLDEAAQCDRVVLLDEGAVVADGSVEELVAGSTAVFVQTEDWVAAWHALGAAGHLLLPTGRGLRLAPANQRLVESDLADAGIAATVTTVPATLEEVFLSATSHAHRGVA